MSYDPNLNPVLKKASNDDLQYLVEIINKTITNSLESDELYKKYNPDHQKYIDLIADEIRTFGGNTFANTFRGGVGPEYKEIVCDVAAKLKAPFNNESNIEKIEASILETVLTQALEKMSDEEKSKLLKELGNTPNYVLSGSALTTAFITIFRAGGIRSYYIVLAIVNAFTKLVFGRALGLAGSITTLQITGLLTGPLALAVSAVWTLVDIAGPATRVTIPAVFYIAMLRRKYNTPLCPHCNQMIAAEAKFCPECGKKLDSVQNDNQKFVMPIDDVWHIAGRGTVCIGRVECGKIKVGEFVDLEFKNGNSIKKQIKVTGIEQFRKSIEDADAGDNVGILLTGIQREEIRPYMVLTKK